MRSCLGILWALDALDQRGADFRNASLLLWPTTSSEFPRGELETRRAFEELIPVREVLEPLIAIRRHLASDSDAVEADLTGLPPRVREWAAVTDNMIDYLPDERGLDVADGHLLNFFTDEWQPAKAIILRFPYPREPGWGAPTLCCDRLMEMSGAAALRAGGCLNPSDALVEARRRDEGHLWDSRLRITPLGSRGRVGEEDWLARGGFSRWVGGRLVTKDRPLRRQGRRRAAVPSHDSAVCGRSLPGKA